VLAFGVVMPLIGAAFGLAAGWGWGCRRGGGGDDDARGLGQLHRGAGGDARGAAAANPALYLTLALGITFPFNLTLGIPLYMALAQTLTGG
jgi:uncharacterized protein